MRDYAPTVSRGPVTSSRMTREPRRTATSRPPDRAGRRPRPRAHLENARHVSAGVATLLVAAMSTTPTTPPAGNTARRTPACAYDSPESTRIDSIAPAGRKVNHSSARSTSTKDAISPRGKRAASGRARRMRGSTVPGHQRRIVGCQYSRHGEIARARPLCVCRYGWSIVTTLATPLDRAISPTHTDHVRVQPRARPRM